MKRPCSDEDGTIEKAAIKLGRIFFALSESTDHLLSACDGCPRMVALLLQLCTEKRARVWLWIASTDRSRIEWTQSLLRQLYEQVPSRFLETRHEWEHCHRMFRPVLWAPCPHMKKGTLYLGQYMCAYMLCSSESDDDDEGIETEPAKKKEEPEPGDFDGCLSLVAHEEWWGATWQPVCCWGQAALHWDFVGSALLNRHNALTALYGLNTRKVVANYNGNKWYRKYLFTCPSYQE
jgi:hypothetical protein